MSGETRYSARWPLTLGFAAIVLLVGGLGAWSLGTQINGAVVASGTVKVESDRQVVQHPDGGVVGDILARDGDEVAAGDVLVRLDGTFLRSELAVIERQLLEVSVRQARLEAERDGLEAPVFADPAAYRMLDPDWIAAQQRGQLNLFEARQSSLGKEVEGLQEQRRQIENQIAGTEAQIAALREQDALVGAELADVQGLFDKGLVQAARLSELRREAARLTGDIGNLEAGVAEARGRIAGIGIEILRLGGKKREAAISEMRDLRFSEIELEERRISLIERLARLDVRAPVSGTVFGSRIFAVQSVVQAADPMMYLVPQGQPLQIAARIDPIHIDQVYPGQEVTLRLTTFDQRTTPVIAGTVARLSPDTVTDEATGERYYEAILRPDAQALADLPQIALMPGLPVEAFLRTRERTPLTYLTQPLTNYFSRAFRED
ncbi:MAG: HlyD family secretion protein [Alphaproteobacteria bacterium]|nr:HlyD family secretion protein [Alphaproteobacteria bacterium]